MSPTFPNGRTPLDGVQDAGLPGGQGCQQLACPGLPQLDRVVATGGGKDLAIRAEGHGPYKVRVTLENGQVTFRYKDYQRGHRLRTLTLDAVEFLRRLLLHVPPHGTSVLPQILTAETVLQAIGRP